MKYVQNVLCDTALASKDVTFEVYFGEKLFDTFLKLTCFFLSCLSDICVAPESQGGFEREQIREQLGGFIGRFSVGRLRRFLSGIIYGNPFRAGTNQSNNQFSSYIFTFCPQLTSNFPV